MVILLPLKFTPEIGEGTDNKQTNKQINTQGIHPLSGLNIEISAFVEKMIS